MISFFRYSGLGFCPFHLQNVSDYCLRGLLWSLLQARLEYFNTDWDIFLESSSEDVYFTKIYSYYLYSELCLLKITTKTTKVNYAEKVWECLPKHWIEMCQFTIDWLCNFRDISLCLIKFINVLLTSFHNTNISYKNDNGTTCFLLCRISIKLLFN